MGSGEWGKRVLPKVGASRCDHLPLVINNPNRLALFEFLVLPLTSYLLPLISYLLSLTSYLLPLTSYLLPLAWDIELVQLDAVS